PDRFGRKPQGLRALVGRPLDAGSAGCGGPRPRGRRRPGPRGLPGGGLRLGRAAQARRRRRRGRRGAGMARRWPGDLPAGGVDGGAARRARAPGGLADGPARADRLGAAMQLVRRSDARRRLPPLPSRGAGVSRHRRRSLAFALAGIVLALLGLAQLGSGGEGRTPAGRRVARVVAVRPVAAGARIAASDLGIVRLPAAWAPRHQLADPADAIGRRAAVGLVAGAPVMDAEVAFSTTPKDGRELALRLDDVAGVPAGDLADVRGDIYLTTPGRRGRTRLVIADVLVVSARHD